MNRTDYSISIRLLVLITCLQVVSYSAASEVYVPSREEISDSDVEIVAGESKTVYEYRVNGYLLMIKVVPKAGLPYYMVPADGSPHYESLDHSQKLYPNWILIEW